LKSPLTHSFDFMLTHQRFRVVAAVVVLVVWALATAFFADITWVAARDVFVGHSGPIGTINGLRGALITAAYSLGGAVVGLGLAWLALPQVYRRGLPWSAAIWTGATALLLGARQVGGWPLLVAALVAVCIGLDVGRRLILTLIAGRPVFRDR
jgi:hypothetical protein